MRTVVCLSIVLLAVAVALPGPARAARGSTDAPGSGGVAGGNGNHNAGDDSLPGNGLRRGWVNLKRSRALLTRAENASDDNVIGWVEIRSDRNRERFRIHVMELTPGDAVSAALDDGIDLGDRIADDRGVAVWDQDTFAGDALPGDVEKVADLSGFSVTVSDVAGGALLTGEVPAFGTPSTQASNLDATAADGGPAWLRAQIRQRLGGLAKLMLRLGELEPGAGYSFWIEDPAGSGEMVMAREFLADGRGRLRLRLMLGDLAGRSFQVRNEAGDVVFSGQFPDR
jgi:hypothetical protein